MIIEAIMFVTSIDISQKQHEARYYKLKSI
jgi:hypothetical protein